MTTSFLNAETLRRSLYAQFKCVFWLITIFVVLAAGPAIVLTEQSTGSGGAINVSGSLRMMSYKLTVAVSNPYATYQERDKATRDAVKEFGTRLESPSLTASVPLDAKNHIRELYELVHKRFSDEVSPLAFESIDSEAARRVFLLKVPGFVDDVDRFVFALEESLSWRLTLLKVCLLITLAGAIALTFIMLSVMRRKVFAPLEELEATAERVRQKNFTARSKSADSSNEIGRFAKSFNFMVSELERLYGSLESEVARTTADLHRRNRGLEFLARASEDLMVDGPSLAGAVSEVLKGAVELAEARSAVFYVAKNREQGWTSETGYLFAKTIGWADAIGSSEFAAHGSSMTLVGMMKVEFGEVPDAWRRNFFEMTASLIGRAVEAVLRVTDEQRLAVLEERSTIARELHDSIAQSLSFSKIQLLRLRSALMPGAPQGMAQEVLLELDHGISTAYRQLREVLSAFRLQLSGAGFPGAVNTAVDAFRNRTGLEITVKNALIGVELSSNDQIHFIQILREALANVEKHARATKVEVCIERAPDGACTMQVVDNGVGIPDHQPQARGRDDRIHEPTAAKERIMTTMNPITPVEQHTVLVVDDHPLFRRGVCELFSLDPTIRVVGEAGTREEALDLAEKLSPDLIVLDLNMKGSSGVEILTTLKERDPSQRVVILTVSDSGEDFFSCIRAGADGYFLKDMEPEKVLYCVRESLEGRLTVDPAMVRYLTDLLRGKAPKVEETVSLTDREEDVLSCIARGMTNKMIGRELKISDGTVKGHVKHLLKKLGFNSRVEAAVWAAERTEKQKRQT